MDTLLKPINAADKVNKKEQEIKIEKVKTEEIKVAEVKKDKENNSIKKEKKEKKPKERLIGPGRGRKTAKILCFETPDRKNPIQEFTTFADARYFLGVKSVGTSLEKASETGAHTLVFQGFPNFGISFLGEKIIKCTQTLFHRTIIEQRLFF